MTRTATDFELADHLRDLRKHDPDDPDEWRDESEAYEDLENERADHEDVPVVD